jgi:hypothetical protein
MRLTPRPVGPPLLVAVALLLAGCLHTSIGTTGAAGANGADGAAGADRAGRRGYSGDAVIGSGRPTTRDVGITGANALVVEAGFAVHVTIGEPERATLRIDDNLVDLVQTRLDGHRLYLGLQPGVSIRASSLSADVTVKQLNEVTASDASVVRFGSELTGDELVLTALSMSEISGPIRVDRVQAGVSGAGRLGLSGRARRLAVAASGASELTLAGLAVAELDARLSGASVADVTVSETIAGEASGASTLRYRGDPRVVRRQSTGASLIDRVG